MSSHRVDPQELAQLIERMTAVEFERFVRDVLVANPSRFRGVQHLGVATRHLFDLRAHDESIGQLTYYEVKQGPQLSRGTIDAVAFEAHELWAAKPNARVVIVLGGLPSQEAVRRAAAEKLEIWGVLSLASLTTRELLEAERERFRRNDQSSTVAGDSDSHPSPAVRISAVTRRNIVDALSLANVAWAGGMNEVDFLKRLYDLRSIPSTDSRFDDAEADIWQHRLNNDDWSNDWIFTDSRFGLQAGPDSTFLAFACEMLHPLVRRDAEQVKELRETLNEHLRRDGWEVYQTSEISGFPIFGARPYTAVRMNDSGRLDDGAVVANRYKIIECIAEGGMGAVYRTLDLVANVRVALKHCLPELPVDDQRRFAREIRGMRAISHPNVMPVLDSELAGALPFFVMPAAECRLDERAEQLRANEREALRAFMDVCAGVMAIHDAGQFHRDLKPMNILLVHGKWVVSDLGLTVFVNRDSTILTRASTLVGTEGYIAPEMRARSKGPLAATVDVFSLGIVLYELMTGADPAFVDESLLAAPLRVIVSRATAANPANRTPTVAALRNEIEVYSTTLVPGFDRLGRLHELVSSSAAPTAAESAELRRLFAAVSPDAVLTEFDRITDANLRWMSAHDAETMSEILEQYRRALASELSASDRRRPYAYAEAVADRMSLVREAAESKALGVTALRCALIAAVELWRFKALDAFNDVLERIEDPDEAEGVAAMLLEERDRAARAIDHDKPRRLAEPLRRVRALLAPEPRKR